MDLNVANYSVIEVFGLEIWVTESLVNTWIIMGILIALAIAARIALTRFRTVPEGFQNIIESVVETFDRFVTANLGKRLSYIAPWYFAVFLFILASSFFSIFGLRAPTADFPVTFAFAMATFILMVVMGIRYKKGKYFKDLLSPHFLFMPINVMGELAKPISLSFRLFGNMLSGTILLALYYALTPRFIQIGIPVLLHGFFDILMGALQTYIFVIMSLMYIKSATE